MNICFGNSSESQRMVDVSNDVIDIRERIEKIREAVENNPVGQTGTETIIPVSNTVELDSIVAENQRQLKADVNTQMLQSSSTEMLSSVDDSLAVKALSLMLVVFHCLERFATTVYYAFLIKLL